MARLIALALLAATPALAEGNPWQFETFDDGALVYGIARPAGIGVTAYCTAPAPQGLTVETPVPPMAPDHWRLDLDRFLVTGGGALRDDIAVIADGTTYPLPPMPLQDETQTYSVDLPMTDPLIAGLGSAQTMVLAIGDGPRWGLPVAGLSDALIAAFDTCRAAWSAAGTPAPEGTP